MKQVIFSILLVLAIIVGSKCKKEKDSRAPFVSFISPQENQSFTVGESIPVKFQVSDESPIEYAQISVLDENQVQVIAPATIQNIENGQTIDYSLLIDNTDLKSGSYFLTVLSSDGANQESFIRKIAIQELPLQRKAIYFVGSNSNQHKVYKIDSTFLQSLSFPISGDFIGASIDSKNKLLITCGGMSGKLKATRLADYTEAWSESPFGTLYPTYQSIFAADGLHFVNYTNGFIKGFDSDGAVRFNAITAQNVYFPIKVGASSKYVLSEQAAFTGPSKKLVLYFYPSGGDAQEFNFTGDVVALYPKTEEDFFVFYNEAGSGKISIYSALGNSFSYTYPSSLQGKIMSVAALSSSAYLVGTESGIFKFSYNPLNYVLFKAGVKVSKMRYDSSSNEVITCEGKELKLYDLTSGMLEKSITAIDSIADFQILYNR